MRPIVWPRANNPYWPLPADYPTLDHRGKRMARVNAASLRGTPELDVASWDFFRTYYLFPLPAGEFYKTGRVRSPDAHYTWVWTWAKYRLSVTAAPRGFAKSTLIDEVVLRSVVTRPYWESLLFLAILGSVSERMDRFKRQLAYNKRIIEDFGNLKPPSSYGSWSSQRLTLRNGAQIVGLPIKGASLGRRPSGEIFFDDVEKHDDLVIQPSELIEAFQSFFLNVAFPMAMRGVNIRVVGTLLSHRTFIYWLQHSSDPRLRFWARLFMTVESGPGGEAWPEQYGKDWQRTQRAIMGEGAYATQYLNRPSTDAKAILRVHPDLNTYYLEGADKEAYTSPFESNAKIVVNRVARWSDEGQVRKPIVEKTVRSWADVLRKMRRVITVDYASTTKETSDYSAIHVLGFENTTSFRDTLYSLDLDVYKWRSDELLRRIMEMAKTWRVPLIGIEAYPLQIQMYERLAADLSDMFAGSGVNTPRIFPIRCPTRYSKPEKIKALEWRFVQNKLKLPADRAVAKREKGKIQPYAMLWYQIENFTEDMGLLRNDDAIDTLAMAQFIGRPRKAPPEEKPRKLRVVDLLKDGHLVHPTTGCSLVDELCSRDLTPELEAALEDIRWEHVGDRHGYNDPGLDEFLELVNMNGGAISVQ